MKLTNIKPNPANPRLIKDDKFKKLCKSISDFPKMMELRPIVVDENNVILGGNMRLRALQHLGYKDIPSTWVKKASELTDEEKKQFIIKDNVGFGEWDWDALANEWSNQDLEDWGVDVPEFDKKETKIKKIELLPFNKSHILISFPPTRLMEIEKFIEEIKKIEDVEIETASN